MAFADSEKSLAGGVPYELHRFVARGTADGVWCYADAPADVSYGGDTYEAAYWIEGAPIEQGSNALRNQTTVKTDWDTPFVAQYLNGPSEQCIDYYRYKGHGADVVCNFIGVVVSVRFKQTSRAGRRYTEIFIDPAANDLRESGLVYKSGRQCQVALFSTPCGVLRAAHRVTGTVASVSGATVTMAAAAGYPVGWFKGGDFIAPAAVVGTARRKVLSHIGNTLILSRSIYGLEVDDPCDVYPGCAHTDAACNVDFNNLLNFKGEPLIPDGDPWGDPIF